MVRRPGVVPGGAKFSRFHVPMRIIAYPFPQRRYADPSAPVAPTGTEALSPNDDVSQRDLAPKLAASRLGAIARHAEAGLRSGAGLAHAREAGPRELPRLDGAH